MDATRFDSKLKNEMKRLIIRRLAYVILGLLLIPLVASALIGPELVPAVLHPMNLNPKRGRQTEQMLARTGATKEDFSVRAADGIELHGWKVRARSPNGDWVLLFHGVSDNRTGVLGQAELLLRNG